MGGGARYDYDLWGQREKLAGDLEADLGYTGHFTHQGAKMVMAPFRQYDAALGRWLSRDPIGEAGGLNLYGYVHSDPVNYVDPNGQFAFIPFLVGMGIGMAIDWAYDKYVDPHVQAFLDDTFGCETANTLRKLKRAIDFARSLKNPIKDLKNLRANAGSLKGLRGLAPKTTPPIKSLAEQAADLVPLNGGRNRVTLRSPSQQMEVDLAGKSHGGVPTPHTKVSPLNPQAPNQPAYNTRNSPVDAASQQDIRTVRRYLERQK